MYLVRVYAAGYSAASQSEYRLKRRPASALRFEQAELRQSYMVGLPEWRCTWDPRGC